MSPQWLTQWSSLVSISISKAECLCVQSRQHGRLLLGSALPASFVLNSSRSTRTSMPLLSLSCRLLLTGLTGDNCAYDFLFSSTRRDKARAQSYSRDSSRWLQDRTYWWNASWTTPANTTCESFFCLLSVSELNHIYYRSTFWDENGDDDEQGNSLVYFSLNYIETWLKKKQ